MENVNHRKKVANDPWGDHLNFFKMISKQSIYGNEWVELRLFYKSFHIILLCLHLA